MNGAQLIDVASGILRPAAGVELRRGMSVAEIDALRLPPGRDFDFKNRYAARGVGYLPYAGREIYYSLKLHDGVLDGVGFGLKSGPPRRPFEVDLELHREQAEFLRGELGSVGEVSQGGLAVTWRYAWGSVGAYGDSKGGTTSMGLRWD